jgi:hypothetical protein
MSSSFELTTTCKLLSVCLLERDIVSWVYPEQESDLRDVVLALHGAVAKAEPFFFGKLADAWFYVRRGDDFALALSASDFNPAKYAALLALQCRRYAQSHDVVADVLKPFLQVFLSGAVGDEWRESSFDYREALLAGSLRRLVERFGADDVVRLWAAMLCKRRILVIGTGDCADLLGLVRSLPLLTFHRQNFGVLRPLVLLDNATQLSELKQLGAAYVAGVLNAPTSPALANALADVVVDVGTRRVRGGDAELSAFEQALATMLTELANDTQHDDAAIVKALLVKTKALIARISTIGRDAIRTSEALPDDLKSLCVSIAQAENI